MKQTTKITALLVLLCPFITLFAQKTIKEEVTLNSPAGIRLSGELEYPAKGRKFPAAILIWGNGPHTRDAAISGSPSFKQMADYLVKKGMAVLRMDKRGFGRSTGKFTSEGNYTTKDLADDIRLAYTFLNKHVAVDSNRVGLIGHSEGSIIASILAAEDTGIDWIIVYGVAAVRGDAIVAEQSRLNRQRLGISKDTSEAIGKVWERYFQFLKSGNTDDSVYYSIGRDFLIAHGLDKDDKRITHAFIDQLLSGYKTAWNRSFLKTDPGEFFQKVQAPVLAVFGADDKQTSIEQNLLPLHKALSNSGNQNYRIVILADEDHFFLRYQDQQLTKHKPGEMKISERLLKVFHEWLISLGVLR